MSSHRFKVRWFQASAGAFSRIRPWREAYCMQPLTFTVLKASGIEFDGDVVVSREG